MRLLFAIVLLLTIPTSAFAGKRQLHAHQHGHGELNIVRQGNTVLIELKASGADVFGFEHAPKNKKQKAVVEKARKDLSEPLKLFVLTAAAGCKVDKSEVEIEQEGSHNEVHAEYKLQCNSPGSVKTIDFKYFNRFKKAEELEVKIIGSKGQSVYEVTHKKPILRLKGGL